MDAFAFENGNAWGVYLQSIKFKLDTAGKILFRQTVEEFINIKHPDC